jgi:hypothetical protein
MAAAGYDSDAADIPAMVQALCAETQTKTMRRPEIRD